MSGNRDTTNRTSADTLHQTISRLRGRPRETWLELARDDQSSRWRDDPGPPVEEYFQQLPELLENIEDALVLVCSEVHLRRERGEEPELAEYQRRFPQLADDLSLQFEIDLFLETVAEDGQVLGSHTADGLGETDTVDEILPFELPGYELMEQIGRGAFSVVYRARQISLNRIVAVKVVDTRRLEERHRARQLREAEILAQIKHPHVVHIYEVLNLHGWLYLVMEYVDGWTLAEQIAGKPLAPRRAAELTLTLSEAIVAIHSAGVMHRDLKPSNVLMTADGMPKVADFGLARQVATDSGLTTEDAVLGTPSYMPPEQALGSLSSMGPRSDVYSLGAVLYELLTSRPPFLGATVLETLSLIREQDPVPPRQLQPSVPRDLQTICLKCLEKSSDRRYTSAADLSEDLRRYLDGRPILARPPGPLERLVRRARRYPVASAAVLTSVLLLVALAAGWWMSREQERRAAAAALVESIASADVQLLPRLIDRIVDHKSILDPLIGGAIEDVTPRSTAWLNLSLAGASLGQAATHVALIDYLPAAQPEEIPLLVRILTEQKVGLPGEGWRQLTDASVAEDVQLRWACLAAAQHAEDPRWPTFALPVARALVRQHPLDVRPLATALRPARDELIPALLGLARDDGLEPAARTAAAGLLARFAPDKPKILAELIVDTDVEQFRVLLPALEQNVNEAQQSLQEVLRAGVDIQAIINRGDWDSPHGVEHAYDTAQRRRAVAAVALWRLGQPAPALDALADHEGDASLRSWIIELSGVLEVSPAVLIELLSSASDPAFCQALVLSLGQSDLEHLSPQGRSRIEATVAQLFRSNPDPGIHSACEWLWRHRLQAGELPVVESLPTVAGAAGQRWFAGPHGHDFVIIVPPDAVTIGSPEYELWREEDEQPRQARFGYSFAMSTKEVAIEQYSPFREAFANRRYSPTPECPINNASWFDAVAYCRWLSEQEGIDESQMCYPPVDDIGPEMRVPKDWLSRTGYRLPTPAEWEYACRGNAPTSRFFGEGMELVPAYAYALPHSDDRTWPVGSLKPNRFGLFDILGSIAEWCQPDDVASGPIAPGMLMPRRGGDFGDAIQNVRSARLTMAPVDAQWANTGFRIVRRMAEP